MPRLGFRRRKGTLVLALGADEFEVLQRLTRDIAEIVAAPPSGDVADRLYPRAYLDPTEEASETEFQSLVHDDLVRSRLAALNVIAEAMPAEAPRAGTVLEFALAPEHEISWLTAFNDARLVLGTVLGVTEDDPADYEPDDPRYYYAALYHWVSALQSELLDVLSADLGDAGKD